VGVGFRQPGSHANHHVNKALNHQVNKARQIFVSLSSNSQVELNVHCTAIHSSRSAQHETSCWTSTVAGPLDATKQARLDRTPSLRERSWVDAWDTAPDSVVATEY
jgi:hypothetical protein